MASKLRQIESTGNLHRHFVHNFLRTRVLVGPCSSNLRLPQWGILQDTNKYITSHMTPTNLQTTNAIIDYERA